MDFTRKATLTPRSVTDSITDLLHHRLFLTLALPLLGIAILAFNYFLVGPMLMARGYDALTKILYLVVRLVIFVGLGFTLARYAVRNRPQTLSAIFLVGAIDQILWKGLWLRHERLTHPAEWAGLSVDSTGLFIGLAQGYLFFTPFVLILGFLGVELTRFRAELARDRALGEAKLVSPSVAPQSVDTKPTSLI